MNITADTNVLLRAVLPDDSAQQQVAIEVLKSAGTVAISVHSLCEFAWVLERRYDVPRPDIIGSIRRLLNMRTVRVNRPAAEAGLEILEAGGDFAEGVIAFEGNWLGGETFVSFDRKAVRCMEALGRPSRLLR